MLVRSTFEPATSRTAVQRSTKICVLCMTIAFILKFPLIQHSAKKKVFPFTQHSSSSSSSSSFFSISKGDWKLLGDQLLAQFLQTCHFQVALTRTILFFPILVFSLTSSNKFIVKETVTVTRLWIANCVQQTGYKTRTEV